jgi:acyl-CoA synthetase (NDP forming)
MSAARAVARYKPVVAIHGERLDTGRSADRPFSADDVYEAALRRAGWVRIDTLGDLFDAAEAMARGRPIHGGRLTILANGHGLGQRRRRRAAARRRSVGDTVEGDRQGTRKAAAHQCLPLEQPAGAAG